MFRYAAVLALLAVPLPVAAASFTGTEAAAIYKGAGFKVQGGKPVGCDIADPGWPRSQFAIEAVDLSGDGKPEAIVSEGNIACYGRDEMGFTIVARNPDGTWRRLAQKGGGTMILKTRHNGWLDVEYGGPGMQKQPVLRYNGKIYQ